MPTLEYNYQYLYLTSLGNAIGQFKIIPNLLKKRFSIAEIAEILELEIEQVRQAIAKLS